MIENYALSGSLNLLAEGQIVRQIYRISDEKSGYHYKGYPAVNSDSAGIGSDLFDINYIFFNPRVGINYNLNEQLNLYSTIAYTSREPRMVNLYNASEAFDGKKPLFERDSTGKYDFTKPLVKPESMLDIETGFSFRVPFFYFNANFYWMNYYDELVKSGQLDIFGAPIDGNAPRTRHYGIEIQSQFDILN